MTLDEQWLLEEKYSGNETPEYEADKKRLASRIGTPDGVLGEPLGYVIGWQPFLGLKIYLDSKPLIPRPETEWWTEQLLTNVGPRRSHIGLLSEITEDLSNGPRRIRFLDLCAGSGAIGCAALARLPQAQVYFGEIDPAHASTIEKNIRENNLDRSRADIRIGDLFEPFGDMKFDIIAANPPYIPAGRTLPASVIDHEPALALFAGEDGLDFIRRIAKELPHRLTENGIAWIECDSVCTVSAHTLFKNQGLEAEILNDQYDKPRIIRVTNLGRSYLPKLPKSDFGRRCHRAHASYPSYRSLTSVEGATERMAKI